MLTIAHITGMIITVLGMVAISVFSAKKVESNSDFILGGREAGSGMVAGAILGTLVGGISTIGTVQLSYKFGLSGIGFTFGAGLGCIALGLFLAEGLRESKVETGPQFLVKVFGAKAGLLSSVFNSIGTFINIVANTLAAVALLTSIFGMSSFIATGLTGVLIIVYVIFGGIRGAGLIGIIKTILIYIAMLFSTVIAFNSLGGISGVVAQLDINPWYHVFERGIINDLAAIFAVIIGFLSTQTYLQAIFTGENVKASRRGAIISGFMMIPLGIMGTIIGLYMRVNYPTINSSQALPIFILKHFPPLLSGIILATLLVVIVVAGAGLTLGVSTMFSQDIYGKLIRPGAADEERLLVSRLGIIIIVIVSLFFAATNLKSVIMEWSYLSMTLRGTSMFLPIIGAAFFKKEISQKAGVLTVTLSPLLSLLWAVLRPEGIDPLYIGLIVGGLILGSSILKSKKESVCNTD